MKHKAVNATMGVALTAALCNLGHGPAGHRHTGFAPHDYFGAHTYERLDQKGVFHTELD